MVERQGSGRLLYCRSLNRRFGGSGPIPAGALFMGGTATQIPMLSKSKSYEICARVVLDGIPCFRFPHLEREIEGTDGTAPDWSGKLWAWRLSGTSPFVVGRSLRPHRLVDSRAAPSSDFLRSQERTGVAATGAVQDDAAFGLARPVGCEAAAFQVGRVSPGLRLVQEAFWCAPLCGPTVCKVTRL
jgi:hypothetical protein